MKEVRVLGTGCAKCNQLLRQTEKIIEELGIECNLEKITDIGEITSFGVMMTPALVVDGEVKTFGKIPTPDELKAMLS